MIPRSHKFFFQWRYYILIAAFMIGVGGLIFRLVYLTVIDRAFLQTQSNTRSVRTLRIPAYRGIITDRNGEVLAMSTPVDSIWVEPHHFKPKPEQAMLLARHLRISVKTLVQRLQQSTNREFFYLVRGVDPDTAAAIKLLAIPGVYIQREFRRYYPEGEVTAHVLGVTNIDDEGQEGLELAYNRWLRGVPGTRRVIRDRLGNIAVNLGTVKEPLPGRNLVLSLDRRIQYLAHRELQDAVHQFKAQSGSIIVMDSTTGEVLAMANQPTYNPNQRPFVSDGRLRNRAVTDVLEPGSVIKTFSVAAALDSGKFKPTSMIDVGTGLMSVEGNSVRDVYRNLGVISIADILKYSSNVGITKMILTLPPQRLWEWLYKFGFGQRTATGFPGERSGVLQHRSRWSPFILATLAFGYGISVTPLQLAQAYSVFAAEGIKRPVSLLRVGQELPGERIIDKRLANDIISMLETVVQSNGSGAQAQVPGYRVAGKTGTTRLLGETGYLDNRHIASFVGIAPAYKPKLVVVVVIDDPREKNYYAGAVAAPVFAKVMAGALSILNVPPDNVQKS